MGRNNNRIAAAIWAVLLAWILQGAAIGADEQPPPVEREFRGLWVATVKNIDWPSRPGLSSRNQKEELLAILDRAAALHFNAIILQVRSGCDAIYPSSLEPWSEFLTGRMGERPSPYYDPLAFAVEEAHKRGLELHAWFNPYRARLNDQPLGPVSPMHVSVKHPELVRTYGKSLWLDPTEPGTREYSLKVILDVVRRYDIDAVHFDDYFYPYPEKTGKNQEESDLEFPDEASWHRYKAHGGNLSRNDWRRQNVDEFVSAVSQEIKKINPRVQFGISPFGIWRPGNPAQIRGFDSYDKLFADSRKWLAEGWVDYCAPQIYWTVEAKAQSFPVLLQWWREQNARHRNLFAGIGMKGFPEADLEINLIRTQDGAGGEILWHANPLFRGEAGVAEVLAQKTYVTPALTPERPWISSAAPARPEFEARWTTRELKMKWHAQGGPAWLWVLQKRTNNHWTTEIFPAQKTWETVVAGGVTPLPDEVAVRAVNNFGNCSEPAMFSRLPRSVE